MLPPSTTLVNFADPAISRGLSSTDIRHNFVGSYVCAVPFDRWFGNGPKRLTQGWQIQGITRFSTGFPIQLNQGDGDASLSGSSSTDMPNLRRPGADRESAQLEPGCPTPDGTGCASSRAHCGQHRPGNLRHSQPPFLSSAPALTTPTSASLKRTVLHEHYAFDVRLEFFNIFNHARFNNPGGNITGSSFGIVTSARDPRIGQVSAKFYW